MPFSPPTLKVTQDEKCSHYSMSKISNQKLCFCKTWGDILQFHIECAYKSWFDIRKEFAREIDPWWVSQANRRDSVDLHIFWKWLTQGVFSIQYMFIPPGGDTTSDEQKYLRSSKQRHYLSTTWEQISWGALIFNFLSIQKFWLCTNFHFLFVSLTTRWSQL